LQLKARSFASSKGHWGTRSWADQLHSFEIHRLFQLSWGEWQLADIRHCILSSVLSDTTEILRARREATQTDSSTTRNIPSHP
jgi:hypothetical protein